MAIVLLTSKQQRYISFSHSLTNSWWLSDLAYSYKIILDWHWLTFTNKHYTFQHYHHTLHFFCVHFVIFLSVNKWSYIILNELKCSKQAGSSKLTIPISSYSFHW
jgi:hypothetical protein